ncbi:MAG: aminoglycoside 6-adenylyltransferase, partial [Anaerolineales bacterium]|nr:aminoglycoside 6-adenylyltransferase [Anaerolineales bacterium]
MDGSDSPVKKEDGTREKLTIRGLVRWAQERPSVRALLLTSSRANPNAAVDLFSDY